MRKIAIDHFIPPQTLRDTLRREIGADGYPSFGRRNIDKKLLTNSEEMVSFEMVSFIYYYLPIYAKLNFLI